MILLFINQYLIGDLLKRLEIILSIILVINFTVSFSAETQRAHKLDFWVCLGLIVDSQFLLVPYILTCYNNHIVLSLRDYLLQVTVRLAAVGKPTGKIALYYRVYIENLSSAGFLKKFLENQIVKFEKRLIF